MIIAGVRHYFAPRVFIVGLYSDFVRTSWKFKAKRGFCSGNAKCTEKIDECCDHSKAKQALSYVDDQLGGMVTASSAGALPHGQQQINDICCPKEAAECDPLYFLMLMCKEAEGKNPQEAFVRLVKLHLIPLGF